MQHELVLYEFKKCLPHYVNEIIAWFPNGKNSIRVRYKDGRDFIFTFERDEDWRYETVNSFIRRMKGD